jgi:hypothetical protein
VPPTLTTENGYERGTLLWQERDRAVFVTNVLLEVLDGTMTPARARRALGLAGEEPKPTPKKPRSAAAARPRPRRAGRGPATKEEAACCMAKLDGLGRPPIGYCLADCERRRGR